MGQIVAAVAFDAILPLVACGPKGAAEYAWSERDPTVVRTGSATLLEAAYPRHGRFGGHMAD